MSKLRAELDILESETMETFFRARDILRKYTYPLDIRNCDVYMAFTILYKAGGTVEQNLLKAYRFARNQAKLLHGNR